MSVMPNIITQTNLSASEMPVSTAENPHSGGAESTPRLSVAGLRYKPTVNL